MAADPGVDDVAALFQRLGFAEYTEAVVELGGASLQDLRELELDDLMKDVGMKKLKAKRLLREIKQELQKQGTPSTPDAESNAEPKEQERVAESKPPSPEEALARLAVTRKQDEDLPLPTGWKKKIDSTVGTWYYNTATKKQRTTHPHSKITCSHEFQRIASDPSNVQRCLALIRQGVDLRPGPDGKTRIMNVCQFAHAAPLIPALVAAGCELDAQKKGTGETAAHFAAMKGRSAVLAALKAAGADLTIRDAKGRTAAYWAKHNGHIEAARVLGLELDVAGAREARLAEQIATCKRLNKMLEADRRAGEWNTEDGIYQGWIAEAKANMGAIVDEILRIQNIVAIKLTSSKMSPELERLMEQAGIMMRETYKMEGKNISDVDREIKDLDRMIEAQAAEMARLKAMRSIKKDAREIMYGELEQ